MAAATTLCNTRGSGGLECCCGSLVFAGAVSPSGNSYRKLPALDRSLVAEAR